MSTVRAWSGGVVLALLATAPSGAVTVETWSATTPEQIARGTLDGTSLDADGQLRLAPQVTTIWGPEPGVVWDLDGAGKDAAFVALSGPARVLRVGARTDAERWFESPEEGLVTSVLAEDGGVLFGLTPGGRVLRARKLPAGPVQSETVVETGSAFVWALARDRAGNVWIGTGAPGTLWRLSGSTKAALVFEAGDDPVRSISALPQGGVVIGTGARGRVIRIDAAGVPFVLVDADETEIASIAVAPDGTVFALAAQRGKPGAPPRAGGDAEALPEGGVSRVTVTASPDEGDADETREETPGPAPQRMAPRPALVSPPGGALYRIDPSGDVRRIWQTTDEIPFAVLVARSGELLVATGDKGRIHAIDREGRSAQLLRVSSNQVSALATGEGGAVLVGGTTDARVEILGPLARTLGSYTTAPIDAGTVAEWGRVRWGVTTPAGARLRIEVRAGNTAEPDSTWSSWSAVAGDDGRAGAETAVPAARFFQARFDLRSGRSGDSPRLGRIEVSYQARNRPPVVATVGVEPAGIVWVRAPSQSSLPTGPVVADDPVTRRVLSSVQPGRAPMGSIRKGYEPGARTFSWRCEDPDRDRLRYGLDLRPEGSDTSYVLARDLEDEFFSWDARGVADGTYRVRLTVDDHLDNPNGTHREAERLSDAFHVDNRRPAVGQPDVRRAGDAWEVAFSAEDPGGQVAALEVALDGGEWTPLSPDDGVADSATERYRLIVPRGMAPDDGERTLLVRVVDAAGNVGGEIWKVGP